MIDAAAVHDARERVLETARHTPCQHSHTFSKLTGATVWPKFETFQRTGAFKIRGATNRLATLSSDEKAAGVVTASAGNHAQGVALAASRIGVDATIVMPEHAPIAKVQATQSYGGTVVLTGRDYAEAAEKAHEIEQEENRTYVHAFDDEEVIAGQGTIGLEILKDCPDVDTIVVPIGGGGLISGIAAGLAESHPTVRIVGVEAAGATSAKASLEAGQIVTRDAVDTVADGIATRRIGDIAFEHIQAHVDEVVTVTDYEIAVAIVQLLERSKTLVEGAGAVPLAAILFDAFEYSTDETIVPVLSGGNIDLNMLTTVIVRGLVETGRYIRIRTVLQDRPGALEEMLEIVSEAKANIYGIQHDRTSRDVGMSDTEVEIDLETRGPDHVDALISDLEDNGYPIEILV